MTSEPIVLERPESYRSGAQLVLVVSLGICNLLFSTLCWFAGQSAPAVAIFLGAPIAASLWLVWVGSSVSWLRGS